MVRAFFWSTIVLLLLVVNACGHSSSPAAGGGSGSAAASIVSFSSSTTSINQGGTITVAYDVNSNSLTSTFIVSLSTQSTANTGNPLGSASYLTSGNISGSKSIVVPNTTVPGSYYLIGDFEGHCPQSNHLVSCSDIKSIPLTVIPAIPVGPTNVSASAGNGSAFVSWSAVSGATAYNIYWSTSPGVTKSNGTKIAGANSPHEVAGLTNDMIYYFVVTAENSAGEGPESAEKSIAPTATTLGVSWTSQATGTTSVLNGVTWGNNQFVAVGDNGTILTSPDGVTWTSRTSGSTEWLSGVAWSGGTFAVVGGSAGNILTSPDGATWTTSFSGVSKFIRNIIWDGSKFLAVGTDTIMTSPDGVTWTSQVSNTGGWEISNIAWSGSTYVAIGGSNGSLCYTSTDGITWKRRSPSVVFSIYGLASSSTLFVAAGWGDYILISTDGISWTQQTAGIGNALYGATWGNNEFVAVGSAGTILTSPDGITWATRASGVTDTLNAVAWSGTQYVAVGGTTSSSSILLSQ